MFNIDYLTFQESMILCRRHFCKTNLLPIHNLSNMEGEMSFTKDAIPASKRSDDENKTELEEDFELAKRAFPDRNFSRDNLMHTRLIKAMLTQLKVCFETQTHRLALNEKCFNDQKAEMSKLFQEMILFPIKLS